MKRERLAAIAVCSLGLVVFALVRAFHPVQTLGNPDIAGILYSADLLNDGLLPYKDSIDLKPPGAFFVVAATFRWLGRDLETLQHVYSAFILAGAGGAWAAARALHPKSSLVVPAVAASLYAFGLALFDMNYSSWMATPYTWAFALLVSSLRSGSRFAATGAGAALLLSLLFKAQAIVLAPLFVLLWVWGRRARYAGATLQAPLFWIAGGMLAALPLVVLYAARGALPELLHGVLPVGEALEYTARMRDRSPWQPLGVFAKRQAKAFALHFWLVGAVGIGVASGRRAHRETEPIAPQLLFYAVSLWGCGIGGMRFYMHYLPQLLPALAILAAHPAAWRWLSLVADRSGHIFVRALAGAHALVIAGIIVHAVVRIPRGKTSVVDNDGTEFVVEISDFVAAHTTRDDRILCWGWSAWPVYYFADRRSPSSVFKVLGQVTEFNGDPGYDGGRTIAFKPGPHADRLLADVEASPPAFIVRAIPFFPGIQNEPLDEFVALKSILDTRYVWVASLGDLHVYERRDHHDDRSQ